MVQQYIPQCNIPQCNIPQSNIPQTSPIPRSPRSRSAYPATLCSVPQCNIPQPPIPPSRGGAHGGVCIPSYPQCNPRLFFGTANEQCPAAFMSHYPCKPGSWDERFCNDGWHLWCENLELMRTTFLCEATLPRPYVNHVQHGQGWVGNYGGDCTVRVH